MTQRVELPPLLAAQLAFMVGFSSVVPFLAVLAQSRYALDATAVGAIVGIRVAAQQGLFIAGGAATDRLGARRLLVTGCVVRAGGFLTIAIAQDPVTFTIGVVLAGAAGALFSPALESLVAQVDAERRHQARQERRGPTAFAALAMAGEIVALAGALAGAAWIPTHSTVVICAAAALFAVTAVVMARVLRTVTRPVSTPGERRAAVPAPQQVRIVPLLIAAGSLLAIYTQLFSLMPIALSERGGSPGWVGVIAAALSIATLVLQWPLSHLAERLGRGSAVPTALGIAGLACVVASAGHELTTSAEQLLGVFLAVTVLIGVSMMLGSPSAQSLVAASGPATSRAMRLGALATCGGVLSLLLSPLVGAVASASGATAGWLLCALLPLLSAPVAAWGHPPTSRRCPPLDERHLMRPTARPSAPPAGTQTPARPKAARLLGATVAGILTVPLLAGCFSSPASSSAEGGDRLSIAMLQPPRSGLNPLSDDAFKLSRWSTAETLVVLDDIGDAHPALATEWKHDGKLEWRFTVRDGVKFHDGSPLTAEAAANSLRAATKATPLPRILDGVKLQIAVDGNQVVLTTGEPDPLLPQRLSSPQLAILAPQAYSGSTVDPIGHGTGPFTLVRADGIVGATLDRNKDYWGEPAQAGGIDVRYIPDGTARAAALRTGEAAVVEAVPVGQAALIDEKLLHEVPMPRTNTLYLNTKKGPFADPAVRAAAREAIDRARIVASAYEGRADIAEGLLGPALEWAAPLRKDAEYQKLLSARAKPAQVKGVPITLGTFTDRAELPEVAVLLEQQLEAAGFVVKQDVREYQFIESDALAGKFDAFILSRATVLDSGDPVAYLASDFSCEGGFAISQLCDPAVDKAISTASQTEAGDKRRDAIMRAEATILAKNAAIPMLHERVIQGEAANVRDAARDPRERALVTTGTRLDAGQ